jgi:hypothetical protein
MDDSLAVIILDHAELLIENMERGESIVTTVHDHILAAALLGVFDDFMQKGGQLALHERDRLINLNDRRAEAFERRTHDLAY